MAGLQRCSVGGRMIVCVCSALLDRSLPRFDYKQKRNESTVNKGTVNGTFD